MSSYAVYVYADASRNQEKIGSNELNWTGTWSSSGSYYASTLDAVLYGDTRYVAITDNVGVNPLARLPNRRANPFSALIVVQPGDEPPFTSPEPTVGYGTVPYSSAQSGTIYYDFSGSTTQETTVNGPLWVSAVNMGAGRDISVVLVPDGSVHALNYSSFKWFGTTPPPSILDKEIVIELAAKDTTIAATRGVPVTQV